MFFILYTLASIVVASIIFILGKSIIMILCKTFNKNDAKIIIVAVVIFIIVAIVALSPAASRAEQATVVSAYYEDDIFVVEFANGEQHWYDERSDIVAGDVLDVNGDDVQLITWDYSHYWAALEDGIEIASFLYAKDAVQFAEETGLPIQFIEE